MEVGMVRRSNGRPIWVLLVAVLAGLAIPRPVLAQGGQVRGTVTNEKKEPIEGATVVIQADGASRRFEAKTNRQGQFMQIGLSPGSYTITAEKDKITAAPRTVTVRAGRPSDVELVIGQMAALSEAAAAKLTGVFNEGVSLLEGGKPDDAIAKFKEGIALNATCTACYNGIGRAYVQKKDFENAEASFKKTLEVNANDAEAYTLLANMYNAQKKFDLAAQASAKASELAASSAGGGGAEALYNQGVIFWNGGKVAEAKKAFEGAVQADPNHAEAHYQLGMVLVNEGALPGAATEFETYLKLAPDGPNAATAKALLAQVKK
jgi:tetratricopeptide (TPR) repeat protein